jgi:hypothetical protein|nr:MAG TPA_asm: hypothetical protein [Bacteriophage sp.]
MVTLAGRRITDECSQCGFILTCELCRQGHGINVERSNIRQMVACQIKHREGRENVGD